MAVIKSTWQRSPTEIAILFELVSSRDSGFKDFLKPRYSGNSLRNAACRWTLQIVILFILDSFFLLHVLHKKNIISVKQWNLKLEILNANLINSLPQCFVYVDSYINAIFAWFLAIFLWLPGMCNYFFNKPKSLNLFIQHNFITGHSMGWRRKGKH